jgi:hypothetical protein
MAKKIDLRDWQLNMGLIPRIDIKRAKEIVAQKKKENKDWDYVLVKHTLKAIPGIPTTEHYQIYARLIKPQYVNTI